MTGYRVFVDTSAWYSLLVSTDQHHDDVRTVYADILQSGGHLVTSTLVLGELYTLLSFRRQNIAAFWNFRDRLLASPRVRIMHLLPKHFDQAFDLLSRRGDKSYSFVDATSFELMRHESIHTALALDRHFAQEGFRLLPGATDVVHELPGPYTSS